MNKVANAARFAEGDEFVTSDEQFSEFYSHLSNCDPATDIAIAERDGGLAGYARIWWYDMQNERAYEPTVLTRPGEGRQLQDALMEAMEVRGREIAATHPPGPKGFYADSTDMATDRVHVLLQRGYQPVRYFYSMVRPNVDDLPDAELPPELEIRPVRPDQLRAIFEHEVENRKDGWDYRAPTEADYEHFLEDPIQGDYTLWRVAWDGERIAGSVRGFINEPENQTYRRKRGFVENINTARAWRRRGVARALMGATIVALRERGMTEAALGVDTENPSGALHLYESCGFVPVSRDATYRKPLD